MVLIFSNIRHFCIVGNVGERDGPRRGGEEAWGEGGNAITDGSVCGEDGKYVRALWSN